MHLDQPSQPSQSSPAIRISTEDMVRDYTIQQSLTQSLGLTRRPVSLLIIEEQKEKKETGDPVALQMCHLEI